MRFLLWGANKIIFVLSKNLQKLIETMLILLYNAVIMDIYEAVGAKVCPNDQIFVGVSGGADSMVLLHALMAAACTKDFSLHVIHVEHGIRGAESVADADFVQNFCKDNGIDCIVRRVDVPSLCATAKQTIEEAARSARYAIFKEIVPNGGKLFLAHNATDQAETVLMHIFRGSGIDGASGMHERDNIFRPLLVFTKDEILEFAASHNIAFVTDATNADNKYTRNYIRNKILPDLDKIYPNIIQNINKFAFFCAEAQQVIDAQVDSNWFEFLPYGVILKTQAFSSQNTILAKAIKQAYNHCGQFADLESKHIKILQNLAKNGANGSKINLPHSVVCEKRPQGLLFANKTASTFAQTDLTLGPNVLPNGKIAEVSIVNKPAFGDGNLYIDWQKVPAGSQWRTRRPGDIFAKFGSGSKKLNDYFTDVKIPNLARDNFILLAFGSRVLCVLGLEIAEDVKVDKNTKQIAKIQVSKNN